MRMYAVTDSPFPEAPRGKIRKSSGRARRAAAASKTARSTLNPVPVPTMRRVSSGDRGVSMATSCASATPIPKSK